MNKLVAGRVPRHLLDIAADQESTRPQKRRLLDIVGKLGQSLFGLATTDDIKILRTAVLEAQRNAKVLFSNEHKLLSVFNKTRDFISQNHHDLETIRHEWGQLYATIQGEMNRTNHVIKMVNNLIWARHIDLNIGQMESAVNDFYAQQQNFHGHRLQLERGWLTEDILPPRVLGTLLQQIQNHHMTAAVSEWYYQNVHVEPLWDYGKQLAYQVVLPGMSSENYLAYKLRYFKVPVGGNHLRQILGNSEVAVNTATGHSFTPFSDHCIGRQPMVCRTGQLHLQETCESGLISGTRRPACMIEITDRGNKSIEVYRQDLQSSEVVLVGYSPTKIITRCLGQPATSQVISGPVIMLLEPNCSLETTSWRIYGVQKLTDAELKFVDYITIPKVNFTWPELLPLKLIDQIKVAKHAEIHWKDLPELVKPTFTSVQFGFWYSTGKYLLLGLVLIVLVILTVVFCQWHNCRKLKRTWHGQGSIAHDGEPFVLVTTGRPSEAGQVKESSSAGDGLLSSGSMGDAPATTTPGAEVQLEMVPPRLSSPYDPARSLLKNLKENWNHSFQFSLKIMGGVCQVSVADFEKLSHQSFCYYYDFAMFVCLFLYCIMALWRQLNYTCTLILRYYMKTCYRVNVSCVSFKVL